MVSGSNNVYFKDDFNRLDNNETLGKANTGETWQNLVANGTLCEIQNNTLFLSDNSNLTNTGPVGCNISFSPSESAEIVITFRAKANDTSSYNIINFLSGGYGGKYYFQIQFYNGTIRHNPHNILTEIFEYLPNVWYNFRAEIDLSNRLYHLYINGKQQGREHCFRHPGSESLNYFELRAGTKEKGLFWVDDLIISKNTLQSLQNPYQGMKQQLYNIPESSKQTSVLPSISFSNINHFKRRICLTFYNQEYTCFC